MTKPIAIIHFESTGDVSIPSPWPVGIDSENTVTSGLGEDDGAVLIGFGIRGTQRISVFAKDALEDPSKVVGLSPTFANRGNIFEWAIKVESMRVL